MRELFLAYARKGAMTMDEVAAVIRRKPDWLRRKSAGPNPEYPRLPGRPIRFDPMKMIEVFCDAQKPEARSLTIEGHKTGAKPNGGFRKCL